MSDIREAVARAIGDALDEHYVWPTQQIINKAADAALAVARPLIEAEARERALREAVEVGRGRAKTTPWPQSDGGHRVVDAILALLPAPATEPALDGWIKWEGGECPVAPDALVEVEIRDGGNNFLLPASGVEWGRVGGGEYGTDIVAYRIVKKPAHD